MIELHQLTIEFPRDARGGDPAVRDVSLTIARGERIGIVGESGSGKSLTALACLGLVPAPGRCAHGSVRIDGRMLEDIPASELQAWRGGTVGLAFQEASSALNPVYKVGFQLVEAIRCHHGMNRSQARERARDLLSAFGVEPVDRILDSYPHRLSGGQAQRVMLSLALAGDPDLLIADEPTSGVDTVTKMEILRLVERLVAERDLGLLLVSHDLEVVRNTVDRIAVMYAGEIVEEGPTASLFDAPLHPYTRLLLASAPGVRGRRPRTSGPRTSRPARGGDACVFAPRCPIVRPSCRSSRPALVDVGCDRRLRCPVSAEGLGRDSTTE